MARKDTLTCLEKRDLLNKSAVSMDTLVDWGERYEAMDLDHDAADFYERAKAPEALGRLLEKAVDSSDVFLFKRLCRLLDRKVSREEWIDLAKKAEDQGKYRFAADAYRQGDDEESAIRVLDKAVAGPLEAPSPVVEETEVAQRHTSSPP